VSVRNRDHYAGAECHQAFEQLSEKGRQAYEGNRLDEAADFTAGRHVAFRFESKLVGAGMIEYQRIATRSAATR